MAVSCVLYNKFKQRQLTADAIDFDGNTNLMVALLTSDYGPDIDLDEFWGDIDGDEVVQGGGYTTNGAAVTGVTVGIDTDGDFAYVDAADVTWAAVTIVCHYAVLYEKNNGASSTWPLIGYINFGADQTPNGVNFTIQWYPAATGGMFKAA